MAESTYTQSYSNFIGTDMSSDPRVVSRNRLAYSVNMWRDYESNQGAAIETIPGFRRVARDYNGETDVGMQGMWHFKGKNDDYIIMHKGAFLDAYKIEDLLESSTQYPPFKSIYEEMNQFVSTTFTTNNRMYIVNGISGSAAAQLIEVYEENGEIKARKIVDYYVPTTYYNGQPYEQRNAFTNKIKQVDAGNGQIEEHKETYLENDQKKERTVEYVGISLYESIDSENLEKIQVYVGDDLIQEDTEINIKYPTTQGKYSKRSITTVENGKWISQVTLYFYKNDLYENLTWKTVRTEYVASAIHFNTIGGLTHFQDKSTTMSEAILGCTKSAVYDGRVFLTGNPDLPNTVFYSQRNNTRANDPTYFGVYNYFNDGDGNTPNVDLLSTPSMLMVIKGDTTQDGSVYYHVGADNPHSEKSVRDLVPRVYPSTQGAAGLGSAGTTEAYSLSCNFLDDPVFLSKRGLEGVSKEQLNAERTLGHRSSNIDKLLIKEDLAHASIAEWKGYLVICCNGHIYLADSRAVSKHQDGSYQYEWFYLEGVGTYAECDYEYQYLTAYPDMQVIQGYDGNQNPIYETVSLADFEVNQYSKVSDYYQLYYKTGKVESGRVVKKKEVVYSNAFVPKYVDIFFVEEPSEPGFMPTAYLVEPASAPIPKGELDGAKRVLAVGDLLFFATDYDICVFNTDKRGVPVNKNEDDIWESDKIDSSWYTFNGVPYKSACALRLDDCDRKSLTKTTIYGTTVARLKMMPGSRCKIKSSTNGRDWIDVAEAYSTRMDFSDLRFDNMAFTENEDNVTVIREVSRGWVQKQYYFESDGFCEPFGLYELSYIYKIAGKIRYY